MLHTLHYLKMSKKINLANEPSAFFCNRFFFIQPQLVCQKICKAIVIFGKIPIILHFIFGFKNPFFFLPRFTSNNIQNIYTVKKNQLLQSHKNNIFYYLKIKK